MLWKWVALRKPMTMQMLSMQLSRDAYSGSSWLKVLTSPHVSLLRHIASFSWGRSACPGTPSPHPHQYCTRRRRVEEWERSRPSMYLTNETCLRRCVCGWVLPGGVQQQCGPVGFHRSCDHCVKQSLLQKSFITWRADRTELNCGYHQSSFRSNCV